MNNTPMQFSLNRAASRKQIPISEHMQPSDSLTLRFGTALWLSTMVRGMRDLRAVGFMIRGASFPIAVIFVLMAFGPYAIYGGEKDQAEPVTAQLFIAGIVDASGTIGYVENGKDTIVAIELATGKEIWKSGGMMQPLIGFEGQLLVLVRQDRDLLLHWIEAATGKFIRASSPMALPEWGTRPIRFGGRGALLDGNLLLECLITEESHGAAPRTTSFHARIALDSGKVTPVAAGESGRSFSQLAPKDLKKAGELTFDIIATTESKAPHFSTTKRTLRALNAQGKVVWTRKLSTWEIGPPKP